MFVPRCRYREFSPDLVPASLGRTPRVGMAEDTFSGSLHSAPESLHWNKGWRRSGRDDTGWGDRQNSHLWFRDNRQDEPGRESSIVAHDLGGGNRIGFGRNVAAGIRIRIDAREVAAGNFEPHAVS